MCMKPNIIKPLNKKPSVKRWAAAIAAYLIVGILSPLGMRALDHFDVKAPLSDFILLTVMLLMMLAVYLFLRRSLLCDSRGGQDSP